MALELVKNTPIKQSKKTRIAKWLGPCASMACLVHCFLLSAVLLIAPGFYHGLHLEHFHHLELAFWTVALLLGLYTLKNASVSFKLRALFVGIALPGLYAYILHREELLHGVLISMAIYQFSLVLYQHIKTKKLDDLECCHHHEHTEA